MERIFNQDSLKLFFELLSEGDISGWFNNTTGGPYLQQFQDQFAKACGTSHAFAVSSGSASIYVALKACNIGPGDLVAVPSYTHIGTVAPIVLAGATPCFIDCNLIGNIEPENIGFAMEKKDMFKAVIAVHQLGVPADIDKIRSISPNSIIIEDASHALGAKYKGRKIGSLGDVGCFSVGGGRTKTIGTGEGGMLTTSNEMLALRIRNIRNHGDRVSDAPYFCFNFRMSEINALIGLIQMNVLDLLNGWQIKNAVFIKEHLPESLEAYVVTGECSPTYYLVGCRFNADKAGMTRDKFLEKVRDIGLIGGVPRMNVSGGYSKLVSDIAYYHNFPKQPLSFSEYVRDSAIWIDWHRYPRTADDIQRLLKGLRGIVK